MDFGFVWPIAITGWILSALAAIAHQVVGEVSWHDLEEYCQLKRNDVFGQIFDSRESISLGTLICFMIMLGIAVVSTCYLCFAGQADVTVAEFWARTALICFGLVFVGSLFPWAVAQVSATQFLYNTWRIWWLVSGIAYPFILGANLVEDTLFRAKGISDEEQEELEEEALEDEIMSIVAEAEHEGHIDEDTRDMIEGVMELDDNDVGQIMTPRSRVDALDVDTQWDEMLTYVVESGRTRIPVYQEKIDQIVGILYAKDLLRESLRSESKRRPLKKLIREPMEVPVSTLLDEMLQRFLQQHVHMAIVKDEYGGVAGVVTIEDVLEEIVGEIVDEADVEEMDDIRKISSTQAEVTGTTHLNRLNEAMGLQLPEDQEFDTVSGLIMKELNEIPRTGREVIYENVSFRIEQSSRRCIELVQVEILPESQKNGNGFAADD